MVTVGSSQNQDSASNKVKLIQNPVREYLGWLIPEDPVGGCGYGPFKLPLDHPFTRACDLHDYGYGLGHDGIPEQTKDELDWDLFWRWTLIAKAEPDLKKRISLCYDIVKLWPLAQIGGYLMWEGDPVKPSGDENVQTIKAISSEPSS